MHEGQEKANRARNVLAACGIEVGTDFRLLSISQIDALVAHAEQHRLNKYGAASEYRRPAGDNDFAMRSFYDLLQRRAMHSRSGRAIAS
jgi:hypothetical protein